MDQNPVIEALGRRLRLAVIGGGPGSFIGSMHRTAARLDDRYDLVPASFADLGPEVHEPVHLSELAEHRVSQPEEVVAPGDEVGVKILSIDTKRRRIELSIRRAAEFGG